MTRPPITLPTLFAGFPFPVFSDIPAVSINGLASDSRQVKPGDLFVCLTGGTSDGHDYIPAAVEKGAAAVIGERGMDVIQIPYIRVDNSRKALPHLAAAYYGHPARKLLVIGITGTDGKTTTANLIFNILKTAGYKTGMISTVNAVIGNQVFDTGFHVTTPDPLDVQRYLAQMVNSGITHVVLEATSHGLAQHRVDACEFDLGVVTNITHEHLDYHGSYTAYRAAKGRLFEMLSNTAPKELPAPRAGILNRDDRSYEYLSGLIQVDAVTYGLHSEADLRAEEVSHSPQGLRFTAVGQGFYFPVESRLVGLYNVSNCLAALAATTLVLEIDHETALEGIRRMEAIPGRMELIDLGQDFTAIIDFAHTPYALKAALESSRRLLEDRGGQGRVISIFGSAGLRDRAKRRMMAETSAELADITILTAEDPRTEPLDVILEEMAQGAVSKGGVEGETFWRIADRGEAIRYAVSIANPGDIVISCGKGHEQSMCFGTVEYLWDDRTALRAALAERLGVEGPDMPYLPTQDQSQ
jgi:UDP-N-acetylmuramoyl-L-alanyl-D-glutamate--2,6-diaminopimelate ligase